MFLKCFNKSSFLKLNFIYNSSRYCATTYYRHISTLRRNADNYSYFKPLNALQMRRVSSDGPSNTCSVDFNYVSDGIKKGSLIVIDVRERSELQETGMIPDSINVPMSELDSLLSWASGKSQEQFKKFKVDEDGSNVVFTCRSGKRAEQALLLSKKIGWNRARFYQGSWIDWVEKGGEVTKLNQ